MFLDYRGFFRFFCGFLGFPFGLGLVFGLLVFGLFLCLYELAFVVPGLFLRAFLGLENALGYVQGLIFNA